MTFNLGKIVRTRIRAYMGRTLETWDAMGMEHTLDAALAGDTHAIRRCYNSVNVDRKVRRLRIFAENKRRKASIEKWQQSNKSEQ